MQKGFDRLRGVAAASAMGLGLLGGGAGSVRAVTVTTKTKVWFDTFTVVNTTSSSTVVSADTQWNGIGNLNNVMGNQAMTTNDGFAMAAGQSAFGISDAQHRFYNWVFENGGAMFLAVANNLFVNPDATVDLTDKTLTTDILPDIIPDVNAQIQYSFYSRHNSSRNGGVVRALYSVTNTTVADIETSMLVMGKYGSGANTTVHGTSDGDLDVEATDYWVASNRYTEPGGMTSVSGVDSVISSHGAGAAVVPVVAMAPGSPTIGSGQTDNFGYRYYVTIPAGETVRVMLFHEMSEWMTEALAAATDFESLDAAGTAGLLTGLSPTQLSEIVNYGAATDTDSDGVADYEDAFPANIAASVDADNDTFPDAWNAACDVTCQAGSGLMLDASLDDTDNDGVVNGSDAFPNDPTETVDTDGDGVGDNADAFPADAGETVDTDDDGVGDNADVFPNDAGETVDTDGDGVGDNADVFPNDASETVDTDGDGVGDNTDVFPNDASETVDTDGDGVGDNADAFPNDATETKDSDSDGVGDNADVYPNDASRSTAPVSSDSGGAAALPMLFSLLGVPALLRRFRKEK